MRARRAASKSIGAPRGRTLNGDRAWKVPRIGLSGLAERLFEREEIAPGEAFFQGRAQQVCGMERGDRADFARAGVEAEPAPARALDPFLDAEQRLGGGSAEADEDVRVGELDLA